MLMIINNNNNNDKPMYMYILSYSLYLIKGIYVLKKL